MWLRVGVNSKSGNSRSDLNFTSENGKILNIQRFSFWAYWTVIESRWPSIISLEFQFTSWIDCLVLKLNQTLQWGIGNSKWVAGLAPERISWKGIWFPWGACFFHETSYVCTRCTKKEMEPLGVKGHSFKLMSSNSDWNILTV